MKDKQLVIATLLLLVSLHTIRWSFALSPLARIIDIIKVPELERRLESIILRTQNRGNPDGASDNLNGDDTTLSNSPSIPEPRSLSSPDTPGKWRDPELSTDQGVNSGLRSRIFRYLFQG